MSRASGTRQAGSEQTRRALLSAAADAFVEHGVQAPVRDIAHRAGVGLGTVYRHFPSRSELVVAVYRHQIEECASLAVELLETDDPSEALGRWINAFADFLVTKHGLSAALQSTDAGFQELHALMLDELVPACGRLVDAAVARGELDPDIGAHPLMRAVGNLCILGPGYERADALQMVARLLEGCRTRP